VIPASFDYNSPGSLKEASDLLLAHPGAKLLAGGHSLIPMMRFRLAEPSALIDLSALPGLAGIRVEGETLVIGAMTRQAEVESSDLVRRHAPLLAETAAVVGDPLVRNLGTIGGNVAHADPGNDHPAAMLAPGASFVSEGPSGTRTATAADFFRGPFETSLEDGDILTEIRVPVGRPGSGGAYRKFERKVGDYAVAAVAAQVRVEGGQVVEAGIALTNVGLTAIRATSAEAALIGTGGSEADRDRAAEAAAGAADPNEDHRGTVAYKRALVRTLTFRALTDALEMAGKTS